MCIQSLVPEYGLPQQPSPRRAPTTPISYIATPREQVSLVKREAGRSKQLIKKGSLGALRQTHSTVTVAAEKAYDHTQRARAELKAANITGGTVHAAAQIGFGRSHGQVGNPLNAVVPPRPSSHSFEGSDGEIPASAIAQPMPSPVSSYVNAGHAGRPAAHDVIDVNHLERYSFVMSVNSGTAGRQTVAALEAAAERFERAACESRAAAAAVRVGTPTIKLPAAVQGASAARSPTDGCSSHERAVCKDSAPPSAGGDAEMPRHAACAGNSETPASVPTLSEAASVDDAVDDAPMAEALRAVGPNLRHVRKSFAGRQSVGGRQSFAALYTAEKRWGADERKSSSNRTSGGDEIVPPGLSLDDRIGMAADSEGSKPASPKGTSDNGDSVSPQSRSSTAVHSRKSLGESDEDQLRRERLERLAKLEEEQARAIEEQQRAAAELARTEEEAARAAAASKKVSPLKRCGTMLTVFSKRRESKAMGAAAPEEPPLVDAEPPRWLKMLLSYREQLAQVEEWLQTEPTEEEVADGSALQKAFTLMSARDELNAKIEQLEAVAAQDQISPGGFAPGGSRDRTRSRTGSVAGRI